MLLRALESEAQNYEVKENSAASSDAKRLMAIKAMDLAAALTSSPRDNKEPM
jgi:hypothetical protein